MPENNLKGPAYRIVTPRLVIRCYQPEDAPLLKAAIDSSLDHLRPWMNWAYDEPEDLETKIQKMRKRRARFDADEEYVYGIFDRAESQVLGGTGLHLRAGPYAREIGYWIASGHIRQGYATEAAAALTRVAFEVDGVRRVLIHCRPENVASASVPRKLGYTLDGILRKSYLGVDDELLDTMIWSIQASEYPASPACQVQVEAYDVIGRRLL